MNQLLITSQIIISFLLVIFILLQQRGAALGGAFGEEGSAYFKKRGLEKTIFWLTVILGFLFILNSLLNLVFQ